MARVRCSPYEANGTVGGKLAQIGSRLIDSTARKMADDFFDKFAEAVGGAEEEAEPEQPAEAPASQPRTEGLSPAVWIGGLVAIAVIVLVIVLS